MIVTSAHEPRWSKNVIQEKAREVEEAGALYGMKEVFCLGLPTINLDHLPLNEIVSAMKPCFEKCRPDVVYSVHHGDVHTDHRQVFLAAWTLMKHFRSTSGGPRRVLLYETLSSTDAAPPSEERAFIPNAFSDITPWVEKKLQVVALYKTEMQAEPLPRSPSAVRALARFRGATIGVEYAEAFQLLRDVF